MIISKPNKFVYIDPPKTASSSLDRLFAKYGGVEIPITPTSRKHNRVIPEYAKDYTRIASIRDPYDKLVSCYFFEYGRGRIMTFEEYVDFHLDVLSCPDDDPDGENYRYFPCSKYLAPLQPIDYYIRVESLQEDLKKLPFYKEQRLAHLHKVNHPTLEEMDISPELMDKINIWTKKDCEVYAYENR